MNSHMSAAKRREHWARHYESDPDWNCRPWLLAFVDTSFEYLEMLFGPKTIAGPLASVLRPAHLAAPDNVPGAPWRETLASAGACASENWPVAGPLGQLRDG